MRVYTVFMNDGLECTDDRFPNLSSAKQALRECYRDDYCEAFDSEGREYPVLDWDYYIEEGEETEDSYSPIREIHYKPYFNRKGTVSLKKIF